MKDKYEGWPEASRRFAEWRDKMQPKEVTVQEPEVEFTAEDKEFLAMFKIAWS